LQIAIVVIDIQGLGDSDNSDEAVDNLLMYVGLQMCNAQIINVNRKLTSFHFGKVAVSQLLNLFLIFKNLNKL